MVRVECRTNIRGMTEFQTEAGEREYVKEDKKGERFEGERP